MNYKFEGTPGPWLVFDNISGDETYGIDGHEGKAVVYFGSTHNDGIRSLHDAHLIAAAPELFEALRSIVKYGCTPNDIQRAHAAIRKATNAPS